MMAIYCDAVSDLPGNLRREAKAGVHDIIHPSTLDRYIMNKKSQRMNEEKKEDNDDKGRTTEEGAPPVTEEGAPPVTEWPVRILEAFRRTSRFDQPLVGTNLELYVGLIGWSVTDQQSADDEVRVNFRGKVPNRSFPKAVISWDYTDQGDHLDLGAKFCFTSNIKDAARNQIFES